MDKEKRIKELEEIRDEKLKAAREEYERMVKQACEEWEHEGGLIVDLKPLQVVKLNR